jgi:hypothetical protein
MDKLMQLAEPRAEDTRFEQLARLAVGRLASEGKPVSRSSLATMSATIDDALPDRKRGFCEATIDNNAKVRAVFNAAKTLQSRGAPRRRGAIPAQIRRLAAWDAARKLILARDATAEREVGLADLLSRTGCDTPQTIIDLRTRRGRLPANRVVSSNVSGCAAEQLTKGKENRLKFATAVKALAGGETVPTIAMIAARASIHPSTVARLAQEQCEIADAERLGRPAVIPPSSLLRLGRREMHRALQLERIYIRAIDRAVAIMAKGVVAREIEAMRAARLEAEQQGCGD